MAWWTGKTEIKLAVIGDSNGVGIGGTQVGVQSPNSSCFFRATPTGGTPYNPANLDWINLDNDGASRSAEYVSALVDQGKIPVMQFLGSNGAIGMQWADSVQQGTDADVYLWQAAAGGATVETFLNGIGWDVIVEDLGNALDALPGDPVLDGLLISLGTNCINVLGLSDEEFYTAFRQLRDKLVAAGFWNPVTTRCIMMDLPRNGSVTGYPGWQGLQLVVDRTNDLMGMGSSVGMSYDAWPVHYVPASLTTMGIEASDILLNQITQSQVCGFWDVLGWLGCVPTSTRPRGKLGAGAGIAAKLLGGLSSRQSTGDVKIRR